MVSELFSSLGNETRVSILRAIDQKGAMSVNETAEDLGLPQSNVSRHLIILKESGAVTVTKMDNRRVYRVKSEVAAMLKLADDCVGTQK